MRKVIRLLCLLLSLVSLSAMAEEPIRQAQEELRKRNLYFGDIDGQRTPEFASALKRYQARKGFAPTGVVDEVTATSLQIAPDPLADAASRRTDSTAEEPSALPEIPILKNDFAPDLAREERIALEKQAEKTVDLPPPPSPAPPAEPPPASQNLSRERVAEMVSEYLRDSEGDDVKAQTAYFSYPVQYFGHGAKDASWVLNDVAAYVKHWPERQYELDEPVNFYASENEGETIVEFLITYSVRNPARAGTNKEKARGRTKNRWAIRPDGAALKITSISEEHLYTNKQ